MDACMNKEQPVPEYQQAEKPQWNTRRNKNMSVRHKNISKFVWFLVFIVIRWLVGNIVVWIIWFGYKAKTKQALDILHWSKSLIAWTSFYSDFVDGDDTMDTILDMTNVFLSSVCFSLLQTDVAWAIFCLFVHVGYLHWHIVLAKWPG